MISSRATEPQSKAAGAAAAATQVDRMRAAVRKAVTVGLDFQRGKVDADTMAHAMTGAVQDFVAQEKAADGDGTPRSAEARHLGEALMELNTCGSGFLAGRCGAD
jgi:hypothetical protein